MRRLQDMTPKHDELEGRKELEKILVKVYNQECYDTDECINCIDDAITAIEKWAKEKYGR